jgi:hypothetical protein
MASPLINMCVLLILFSRISRLIIKAVQLIGGAIAMRTPRMFLDPLHIATLIKLQHLYKTDCLLLLSI